MTERPPISIRLWEDSDLPLELRMMGDPAMMVYLGGPETEERSRNRHERFLKMNASESDGRMYAIVLGDEQTPVGAVGFWEHDEKGEQVWEMGWSVLPDFQGKGVAKSGTAMAIDEARALRKHRFAHAYPSVENAPSNALCRALGFVLLGVEEYEYPPGTMMRCNNWQLDLFGSSL